MRCVSVERLVRLPWLVWLAVLATLMVTKLAVAEPYKAGAGPFGVESFLLEFDDAERGRAVPVRVYFPKQAEGPRPVVLVSHGLGGTHDGLSYLGNHWASHGYICIHMQHLGSDDSVWRDLKPRDRIAAMRHAAKNPGNALNRAGDVTFILDELDLMNKDKAAKLYAKLDLEKVAIAGHSFGAWTAMAAGGMTVGGQRGKQYNDVRILCMIPLSPPVAMQTRQHDATYGSLNIPALFMTGTLDTSIINNTKAEDRLLPYQIMPGISDGGAPKYLINFNGADHMTFSGETKRGLRFKVSKEDDQVFHSIILQSTTAFLDTYLLEDEKAKAWLNDGEFVKAVGDRGDVEMDVRQAE